MIRELHLTADRTDGVFDSESETAPCAVRAEPDSDSDKQQVWLSIATMTIHNLYIFSRTGTLLYYTEWNRLNKSGITKEEEAKLMYGMLFSIKSFVNKISPLDPKEGFLYYKTSKYTLHYLETPSGLKFVLNTDNAAPNTRELLQQLYSQVYLEYVVKNPICQLNEPIQSEIFKLKVDELMKKSPIFLSRSL